MLRHLQRARLALRARRSRGGDDGIALVAAIGVAVVALVLATTVVAVTVRSTTATGEGRDRDQAYAAAEAGVDAAAAVLGADPVQWLALCPVAPAVSLPAVPLSSTSTYRTTVTFGSALTVVGAVVETPCGAPGAAYARVVSTGTASTGAGVQQKRTLTSVLMLHAPLSGGASGTAGGYGILGTTVDLSQAGLSDLGGTSGMGVRALAGDITCDASMSIHADVVVSSGKLVTEGLCTVDGDVKAAAGLTLGSMSTITGSITTKPGMPVVRGSLSSAGPVLTSADDPAWVPSTLPRITQDLAAWTSEGFVAKHWTGSCSIAGLTTRTLTQTGPTIYDTRTDCPSGLALGSSATLQAQGGDVVLLVNGFTASGLSYISSATPGRRVWLVVPTPDTGSECPAARNISFGSNSGGNANVKLFLYTPCTVSLGGLVTMTGQVWGGTVRISTQASVHFSDLGIPSAGGVVRLSTSG